MGSVEARVMRVEGRVELGWVIYSSYIPVYSCYQLSLPK